MYTWIDYGTKCLTDEEAALLVKDLHHAMEGGYFKYEEYIDEMTTD